jgi:hypothetical protein
MKFNLSLQTKLFEKLKNYIFGMSIDKINKLLLLLSKKYKNDEFEKTKYLKILFDYIYKIFKNSNVEDFQRESIFLLYKNNKFLCEDIFIQIISIFILYLEFEVMNKKEGETLKRRKQTVLYLLNSNNKFIENLLYYLSKTNIHIKKAIINLLRVLTQKYGELLDEYFLKETKNKKNNKDRINKQEFYNFIKENIIPNYYNEKIEKDEDDDNKKTRKRKNSSIIFFKTKNYKISNIKNNLINNKVSKSNLASF